MAARRAQLSDYDIVDRFAVGGAAELYRARDKSSGEIVIIKKLRSDQGFDPEMSAGFLRESQLAMQSDHKNLIRGLARGTHSGDDWVCVEYVDGQDLERLIVRLRERDQSLPEALALFVVCEILDGLAFAYNIPDPMGGPMGLVHRDLNPRNVLVSYEGRVHVADFGASIASLNEPPPNEIVGSVGYMAPEQASLGDLDGRTDIFAAGCILFELIAGEPAFDVAGKKDAAILKLHKRGQTRPVPQTVSENLRFAIEIACAPDPEDRYQSASQMRDALTKMMRETGMPADASKLGEWMRALFEKERASVPVFATSRSR
jgi:serine/threonine-protein kinase